MYRNSLLKKIFRQNVARSTGLFLAAALSFLAAELAAQPALSGSETIANTTIANTQQNPSVAVDSSGRFIIVWESEDTDGSDFGIYASVFNSNGTTAVSQFLVNSTTANAQRFPSVGCDVNGNFVVAWQSESQDGDGWGIYARRYTIAGTALSSETLINATNTAGSQKHPHVSVNETGAYLITWSSEISGSFEACARLYDNTGTAQGAEFIVNTYQAGFQGYAHGAIRSDGASVITWQSEGQDASGHGIYAQRLSPSGAFLGSEFIVNSDSTGNQQEPDIDITSDGDFVIAWSGYAQDGDREGIYAQRFDSSGTAMGTEFQVNSTTSGAQENAAVCMNDTGYFVVAWNSYGQDGSYSGVYAQAYMPGGNTFGSETLVNTTTTDFQQFPEMAFDRNDLMLVATWQDGQRESTSTHDGDDYGVYFQILDVQDTTAPVPSCQNITIYLDGSGNATITGSDVDNGSSDNSGQLTLSVSPTSFTCANIGANSVTLTVTDGSGNSSTCSAIVTVTDSTAPVALCQNITVYLNGSGNVSITANDIDGGSTDNCSVASLSASTTSFTCADIGSNSVTLTATDGSGNTSTCTATVTVADTIAPTALCQNITVYLDGSGNATITANDIDNGSTDNCSVASLNLSQTAFTCAGLGTNSVTLTVTDGSGNASTCSATVTVADSTAPVASCQNITVYLDGSGNASITASDIDNGSTDNCSAVTLSASQASFTCANIGTNSVMLTVTDGSGNTSTCTATVTVTDTIAPTALCQNITVYLNGSGNVSITANDIDGGSTDNCSAVTLSASQTSFSCADIGSNSVTLTVTDGSGNSSGCSVTVTVADSTAPVVTCQNITVYLDGSGNASITANDIDGGSTDNCSMVTVTASQTTFTCGDAGNVNVTLTGTDASGNSSNCTATVTVADTISPVASCQNITAYLDGSGNVTINASDLDGGSTDNCSSPLTFSASPSAFTCSDLGTNTVTLTVTDGSGNMTNCVSTVTIADTVSPVVVCQNITVYLDGSGNTSINASDLDGGSTDNCSSLLSFTASQTTFTCANAGNVSVVLTATDASGNSSSCTATVTVADTVMPVANCQPVTVYLDASGNVTVNAADLDNGSSDGCGSVSFSVTPSSFTCAQTGANSVTFTVTDAGGNTASCLATVTVLDTIAPAAVCTNITAYLDTNGLAVVPAAAVDGGSSDNCSIASMTLSQDTFTLSDLGTNPVTLVVTDASGNVDSCTATITVSDSLLTVSSKPVANGVANWGWNVWPNPARDLLQVEVYCGTCALDGAYTLVLTDMYGQVVMKKSISSNGDVVSEKISIQALATGVYQITLKSGNRTLTRKVIKL